MDVGSNCAKMAPPTPREGSPAEPEAEDSELSMKPNARFKNYSGLFDNLTKHASVSTEHSIISVMLSYDSTRAITVVKKDECESWVQMFSLQTYE